MPESNPIPEKYFCSITDQVIIDPVITSDGHTYEREAIKKWLQAHDTSPKTNIRLKHKNLTPNHDKRSDILEFLGSRPELYEGNEVYLPKAWMRQCVAAIKNNQYSEVQGWLTKDRRLLTCKLEGESTALHLACTFSSPELVDILLKLLQKGNKSIMSGVIGFKPTHLNVLLERDLISEDYAKCKLLLGLGAEIEQAEVSIDQNTLLHRMVIRSCLEPVRWLLKERAFIDAQNLNGDTPLHLAAQAGHNNIVSLLLGAGACPEIKNEAGKIPIELAKKLKTMNVIVGTLLAISKAKLEEKIRLDQIVVVQPKKKRRKKGHTSKNISPLIFSPVVSNLHSKDISEYSTLVVEGGRSFNSQ